MWGIVLSCLIFFSLYSNSFSQEAELNLTAEEIQWINDNPTITATNNQEYVPYDFVRGGTSMGFAVDYVRLVASKVGLEVEFVSSNEWQNMLEMVGTGEIDILHSAMRTNERAETLHFLEPYVNLPAVSFGRVGDPPINTYDDLIGKKIGVIRDWAAQKIIESDHPDLTMVVYNSLDEVFAGLKNGDIDLYQSTPYSAIYYMEQNFITDIGILGPDFIFTGEHITSHRLATSLDNTVLASILEKGMSAVSEQEFNDLANRWLDGYVPPNDINLTAEEKIWLQENRDITIVAEPDLAPLVFRGDNGTVRGITVDFFKMIGEKLNIDFKWEMENSFSGAVSQLQAGTADIIPAINPTLERREQFNLTSPMIEGSHMVFARSGSPVYGSMDALLDKKLVQVRGYSVTGEIKARYPGIDIVEVESLSEALRYITSGQADAFISDILVTSYYISQMGFANIVVVGETEFAGDVAVAVRKDAPILASIINKALATISPAEKAEIQGKWLSLDIRSSVDYSKIWQVVTLSALFMLGILLWNRSLHREIQNRKKIEKELMVAQSKAEAESQAKSIFLANMSHEIRTPLNAIVGFSEAMKLGIYGRIEEPKYQAYLDDICDSGKHLTTVINDILDLSKIEAGKMKINEEEFVLEDCLVDAIQMNKIQADAKKINVDFECCHEGQVVSITGDIHMIKRAIVNLLSNAVKFTPEGGEVWVRRKVDMDGSLVIEIEDTGIGIPADRIDAVVKPFEQGSLTHEINEEGTGLGLPIVKNLIELHGGTFELRSVAEVGTKAVITLPEERVRSERFNNVIRI